MAPHSSTLAWKNPMDGGSWHCTGGSDQNHSKEKEIQEGKVFGTLPTKVHVVKVTVFPVVMYRCESWTVKKAEHQRIDAFELWCWRRLFRVPWTEGRSNQSILKEINPEYSLEGRMLKLRYLGHLIPKTDSLGKTLMLEKISSIHPSAVSLACCFLNKWSSLFFYTFTPAVSTAWTLP